MTNDPILRRKRMLYLNLATYAALMAVTAWGIHQAGWTVLTVALLAVASLLWLGPALAIGNLVVGTWLLHGRADPRRQVAPFATQMTTPLTSRVAVVMTLRNEDANRALTRLRSTKASIDATGSGDRFDYFVLSDTNRASVAADEEQWVGRWRQLEPTDAARIVYRRRDDNAGFKAGNIRDFGERWGHAYAMMLPLDADSAMSGHTVLELARILEANPGIGILQTQVSSVLPETPLARLTSFPLRTMRLTSFAMAWRLGDRGPYWGHNAMIRLEPFLRHCRLPVLQGAPPFGGPVMMHDQVEAAMMAQAGYQTWLLPWDTGSWEEAPPTLFEWVSRDVRWGYGSLQFLRLTQVLDLPSDSKHSLWWSAVSASFSAVSLCFAAVVPAVALWGRLDPTFPAAGVSLGLAAFAYGGLCMRGWSVLDAALTPAEAARFGGAWKVLSGALAEVSFDFLIRPAYVYLSTVELGWLLIVGRRPTWSGQQRDSGGTTWAEASRRLWPATAFGLAASAAFWWAGPGWWWINGPLIAGYLLAIPMTVFASSTAAGQWLARTGICPLPEDLVEPPELATLRSVEPRDATSRTA